MALGHSPPTTLANMGRDPDNIAIEVRSRPTLIYLGLIVIAAFLAEMFPLLGFLLRVAPTFSAKPWSPFIILFAISVLGFWIFAQWRFGRFIKRLAKIRPDLSRFSLEFIGAAPIAGFMSLAGDWVLLASVCAGGTMHALWVTVRFKGNASERWVPLTTDVATIIAFGMLYLINRFILPNVGLAAAYNTGY